MYASKNNSYHQDALRFYQKNVINNNFDIREMKTENDFDQSHVLLRPIILGIIYGETFPEMRFFAIATAPAFELMTRDTQEVTLSVKLLPEREREKVRGREKSFSSKRTKLWSCLCLWGVYRDVVFVTIQYFLRFWSLSLAHTSNQCTRENLRRKASNRVSGNGLTDSIARRAAPGVKFMRDEINVAAFTICKLLQRVMKRRMARDR